MTKDERVYKKCPFCGSTHTEGHTYSLSQKPWYLCRECGQVWDDKSKEESDDDE